MMLYLTQEGFLFGLIKEDEMEDLNVVVLPKEASC
jgi:hypothetical protein